MATTVSYSASMRTRKSNSSSNSKSSQACQEFYTTGYNYVGILHFSGLNLTNKVITAVSLTVYSEKAGLWRRTQQDGLSAQIVSSGSLCFRRYRSGLLRRAAGYVYRLILWQYHHDSLHWLLAHQCCQLSGRRQQHLLHLQPQPVSQFTGIFQQLSDVVDRDTVRYLRGRSQLTQHICFIYGTGEQRDHLHEQAEFFRHAHTDIQFRLCRRNDRHKRWCFHHLDTAAVVGITDSVCDQWLLYHYLQHLREWEPDGHLVLFCPADRACIRYADHFQLDLCRSSIRHRYTIWRLCEASQ